MLNVLQHFYAVNIKQLTQYDCKKNPQNT